MVEFAQKKKHPQGFWEVTPKELATKLADVSVIDVRRPEEYSGELGHIQSSRLVTLETQLDQELNQLSKEKPIVFVCRSGGRSGTASMMALQKGFQEIYNMAGGMIQWNADKLSVTR